MAGPAKDLHSNRLSRYRPAAGLAMGLAALGLLYCALRDPLILPRLPRVAWAGAGGRFLFLAVIGVASVGALILAWFLVSMALGSWKPRSKVGHEDPPHVHEVPPTPPLLYLVPLALLAALVGFVVWLARGGPSPGTVSSWETTPPGGAGLPIDPGSVGAPDPLLAQAWGILGLVLLVAGLAGLVALMVTMLGSPPPRDVTATMKSPRRELLPEAGPGRSHKPIDPVWDSPDPAEGVSGAYETFVYLAEKAGVTASGRTPREFRDATASKFPSIRNPVFGLTAVYEKCRFGRDPVTVLDRVFAREAYDAISLSLTRAGEGEKGDR